MATRWVSRTTQKILEPGLALPGAASVPKVHTPVSCVPADVLLLLHQPVQSLWNL